MNTRIPTRAKRRAGSILGEFALGSGVLLALFGGTFRLGYTFLEYNKLEIAAAQGARFASLVPYDSSTTTPSAAFLSSVRNMVLYGSPSGGTSPVLPGLTAQNVVLTVVFTNGVPGTMTVSISGFTIDAVFGHVTLSSKPRASFPYQGIWAPL